MSRPTAKSDAIQGAKGALLVLGLIAAALLAVGQQDYPNLHAILDAIAFLSSGVIALLLRDVGKRTDQPFAVWIAHGFGVTAVLEAFHTLVTVEWTGPLLHIVQNQTLLRPATWPPAAVMLAVGTGIALALLRAGVTRARWFLIALVAIAVGLAALFYGVPAFTSPTLFGITRPALIPIPLLYGGVAVACWRYRLADRLLPLLAITAAVLVPAHVAMLYAQAPHDGLSMVAHVGKVGGYLLFLLSLMQLASRDLLERLRAEAALARLNAELEHRVETRTSQLTAATELLEGEVAERCAAQDRVTAQLTRMQLLHEITRATGKRQDLQSIYQVVIRSVEEQLPVDFCCICRYDKPGQALVVTSVGVRSAPLAMELAMTDQARIGIDQNGLARCVSGLLVHEPNITGASMPFPARLARGGLGSFVAVPLMTESSVFGVLICGRRQPNSFTSGECEFLRQLGEHVGLAAHQAQLYEALRTAYDDLRQSQDAVMQQERLRALGQMASGVAHDINNAITAATLYTESLLEQETNLSPGGREDLQTIQRAIEDVSHTVSQLGDFYRRREPALELQPIRLNDLLGQAVDLTRARWSDMPQRRGVVIRMQLDLAADLPVVMGVESEIREALINLVFNAVDAMPEGGVVVLRSKAGGPAADSGPVGLRHAILEVVDTGMGMDEATRSRSLEPFFSTKGDRGSGLGLAMVYGIAQRHSAEIEIDSEVGKGTTVRLVFPPADAPDVVDSTVTPVEVPRGLRVLVVDDDPVLLKTLRDILEQEGQVVETADGGQAGIDAFLAARARAAPFALVLTDLGMPHVDGRQVASAVKEVSPSTPVVMLTGWGQRLVAEGDIPPHVDRVLSKPPKLRQLREMLALGQPRGNE